MNPESVATAIRAGATTTAQIAAACGCPDDDDLYRVLDRMHTDGWFTRTPTGPGTYRLDLADNAIGDPR